MELSIQVHSHSQGLVHFATTQEQSEVNLLQGFLSSVEKRQPRIAHNDTTLSIANKLSLYRSLALREFDDVIQNNKWYDPFLFWNTNSNKLKFLSSLARRHLIVSSTSVSSESMFSIASYVGRKEKNRLAPDNLCTSVFLEDKCHDSVLCEN